MKLIKTFCQRLYLDRYYIIAFIVQIVIIIFIIQTILGVKSLIKTAPLAQKSLGHYIKYYSTSNTTLDLCFTENIYLSDTIFFLDDTPAPIKIKNLTYFKDPSNTFTAHMTLDPPTQSIKTYTISTNINDNFGTKLPISINFTSYNNNKPDLEIIAIQFKSSKEHPATKTKPASPDIFEYVDIRAKTSGNLFGLTVYSVNDGENKNYTFCDRPVKSGEVVHVQFRDVYNSQSFFNNTSDIIVLRWLDDSNLADLIPYSDGTYSKWKNDEFTDVINEAIALNIWQGGVTPDDAVYSKKSSVTKPLIKLTDGRDKNSWGVLNDTNKINKTKKTTKNSTKKITSKDSTAPLDSKVKSTKNNSERDTHKAKNNNKSATVTENFFKWERSNQSFSKIYFTKVQPLYSNQKGNLNSEYIVLHSTKDIDITGYYIYCIRSKTHDKYVALGTQKISKDSDTKFNLFNNDGDDTDILDNNMGIVLLLDNKKQIVDFLPYKRQDAKTTSPDKFTKALEFAEKNNIWDAAQYVDSLKKNSKKPLARNGNGIGKDFWSPDHD